MADAETFDALLKVVIIGDSAVGKTCLILRYTQDIFRANFLSTIGVDFKTKTVNAGEKRYKLQIWDTAGQERYNTIRRGFYRGAKGVVVVYDVTNAGSFANVGRWVNDIKANCGSIGEQPAMIIVGNKADCSEEDRAVTKEAGTEAAREFDTKFSEVSALTGEGVDKAFDNLVSGIAEQLETQGQTVVNSTVVLNRTSTFGGVNGKKSCTC